MGLPLLRASEPALTPRFFARLNGIAPRHFLVPRWMECPCPSLANCPTNHCLKGSRLADCAEIDVNEDSAQHDERGDVVQDVAHGHSPSSERARSHPQNDSCDQVDN